MSETTPSPQPLKPCPCCGSRAEMRQNSEGWTWVECALCGLATMYRISHTRDCRPLAADAWNKRTPEPAQEALPL